MKRWFSVNVDHADFETSSFKPLHEVSHDSGLCYRESEIGDSDVSAGNNQRQLSETLSKKCVKDGPVSAILRYVVADERENESWSAGHFAHLCVDFPGDGIVQPVSTLLLEIHRFLFTYGSKTSHV